MLKFLKEFNSLTHAEQRVFLFCAEFMPEVKKNSSDVRRICLCLGLSYKTVLPALHAINESQILSRVVKYIHSDICLKTRVRVDLDKVGRGFLDRDLGDWGSEDWDKLENVQ